MNTQNKIEKLESLAKPLYQIIDSLNSEINQLRFEQNREKIGKYYRNNAGVYKIIHLDDQYGLTEMAMSLAILNNPNQYNKSLNTYYRINLAECVEITRQEFINAADKLLIEFNEELHSHE